MITLKTVKNVQVLHVNIFLIIVPRSAFFKAGIK